MIRNIKLYLVILVVALACTPKLQKTATKLEFPGTVKLNDSLFIDYTPVLNIHILEYIYVLESSSDTAILNAWFNNVREDKRASYARAYNALFAHLSPQEKQRLYPSLQLELGWVNPHDTVNFTPPSTFNYQEGDYVGYYLFNKKYRFHPMVNFSVAQAQRYCDWRTLIVKAKQDSLLGDKVEFIYRLPNAEEWKLAYTKLANGKSVKRQPLQPSGTNEAPTVSYEPYTEQRKFYFIENNVSEMLAGRDIIGSSWRQPLESDTLLRGYRGPADDLGFRCICEVKYK